MTTILGTNVNAPIVPFDSSDGYPSHIDIYGKGGYRSVNTYSDILLIPNERISIGMKVRVIDEDKEYYLNSNLIWTEFKTSSVSNTFSEILVNNKNIFAQSSNDYFQLVSSNLTLDVNDHNILISAPLYDGINSNSNLLFATANSVKISYDLANSKNKTYYANDIPELININDSWINSNTGIKYNLIINDDVPILVEFGPDITKITSEVNNNSNKITTIAVTNSPIGGNRVVAKNNNIISYADKDDNSCLGKIVGITISAVSSGNIEIMLQGIMEFNGWNWNEGFVYLGNNGLLTQDISTTGFIQILGTVINSTTINFNPQTPINLGN